MSKEISDNRKALGTGGSNNGDYFTHGLSTEDSMRIEEKTARGAPIF